MRYGTRRFYTTPEERERDLGPTIPAPERYINEAGYLVYAEGDPVPVGAARALGWMGEDEAPPEPEPIHATNRGRKIRAANRDVESSA